MKLYSAYDRPVVEGVVFDPEKPSKTVQSQSEEADINTIVKRFGLTGKLPENVRVPEFADFEDVFDFQSAMNAVRLGQESFMRMPADIRNEFYNDPQRFVEFCTATNEDGTLQNLEEMRAMGLAVPKKDDIIPPVMKVEVVNPEVRDESRGPKD